MSLGILVPVQTALDWHSGIFQEDIAEVSVRRMDPRTPALPLLKGCHRPS